jgi:hypothetical protein
MSLLLLLTSSGGGPPPADAVHRRANGDGDDGDVTLALARTRWAVEDEGPAWNPLPGGTAWGPLQPLTGSYTLTGQAATLTLGRRLTAEAGTYSLTGVDAALRADRRITGAAGAYSLTGVAAGLRADRRLTGDQGTYSLTGVAADLLYSGVGGSPYTLTAAAGTYSLTGVAAALRADRRVAGTAGAYSLTGVAAGLRADRRMAGGTGTYSLAGVAAGLARGLRVAAAAGTYTLTGQSAALRAARSMAADAGSYLLTGIAAGLNYTGSLNNLGRYVIELLGLERWLLLDRTDTRYAATDRTVTRYAISEDPMTTVTTAASSYLWLTEDQEAEFEFSRKNASTGVLEAATGLTGMTVHIAASAGGSVIGALTFNLTERGTTGIYYAVMDTATLVSGLAAATYPDGTALYLVVSKSGDIASRSFRKLVKRQRVGDG